MRRGPTIAREAAGLPARLRFRRLGSARAELGESPVWDPAGAVWWVDVEGRRLLRTALRDGATCAWPTPERAGFVVLTARGRPAVGMESGIFLLAGDGRGFRRIAPQPLPGQRYNDAAADAAGRLWAATLDLGLTRPEGRLWCLGPDRAPLPVAGGLLIANGIAVAPDLSRLFLSDSAATRRSVATLPLDPATGLPGEPRPFARLRPREGRPDGAVLDRHGRYWLAGLEGAALHVLGRAGRRLRRYLVPCALPTKPAFGGPGLRLLFLTSKAGPGPLDGTLLVARLPRDAGLPPARWIAGD